MQTWYNWYCHVFYNLFENVRSTYKTFCIATQWRIFHSIPLFRTRVTTKEDSVDCIYANGFEIIAELFDFENVDSHKPSFWSQKVGVNFLKEKLEPDFWFHKLEQMTIKIFDLNFEYQFWCNGRMCGPLFLPSPLTWKLWVKRCTLSSLNPYVRIYHSVFVSPTYTCSIAVWT